MPGQTLAQPGGFRVRLAGPAALGRFMSSWLYVVGCAFPSIPLGAPNASRAFALGARPSPQGQSLYVTVCDGDTGTLLVTEGRRAGRTPSGRITLLSFTARPHGRNQRGARQLLEKIYATCGEVGERDSICFFTGTIAGKSVVRV